MILIKAFVTQMESFSKEICELYPEDTDLKLGHNLIIIMGRTVPNKLIEIYDQYVLPYKTQIDNRDERFFIDHSFEEVANKNGNGEMTFNLVRKLKEYWTDFSDQNKDSTWRYFEVLNKISDKIKSDKLSNNISISQ